MAILQVRNFDSDLHLKYKVLAARLGTDLRALVLEVMENAVPELEKQAKAKEREREKA